MFAEVTNWPQAFAIVAVCAVFAFLAWAMRDER